MRALITPSVLKWAREEYIKITVDYAAKKLRVKPERLLAWEAGEKRPTFNQLKQIATLYRTHLSVFYLPEPPKFEPIVHIYKGFDYDRKPNDP